MIGMDKIWPEQGHGRNAVINTQLFVENSLLSATLPAR